VKLALDRERIAKAAKEAKTTLTLPEHTFISNVDDSDSTKGKTFSVSVSVTPAIVFESGKAKSLTLDPVKTEGSTVASAAVASLMARPRVRAAVAEINSFLFKLCKEEGVEITHK
jgi:hypothetical protein